MKFIKFEGNWADEMDISGFAIFMDKTWDQYLDIWKNASYPQEYCVGTNESIEFDSFNDFCRHFDVQEIEEAEAATIRKFFEMDDDCYGFFPSFEPDIEDDYDDEDFFDEDEDDLF